MRYIKEIIDYRHLILNLASKEIKLKYKSAALGCLWSLLHPLLLMSIFYVIFTFIIRMEIANYPLFLLCALLPWFFLSSSLAQATTSIVDNSGLLKKAYFPQEVIPLSIIGAHLFNFLISLLLLILVILASGVKPAFSWIFLPALVILQIMFVSGVCFISSALYVFFRDMRYAVELFLIVWFYATPVFYPLYAVPDRFRGFFYANPLTIFVTLYRDVLIYGKSPDPAMSLMLGVASAGFFLAGIYIFGKKKRFFVDMT